MQKYECENYDFSLLKRLNNGQYMNLTDLDFENSRNVNNEYYDLEETSEYVLMFLPSDCAITFYAPVELETLVQYAPSIKKLKKISIADVIMAKLMNENTSLFFSVEYDEKNPSDNKVEMYLKVLRDNNRRRDIENVTVIGKARAEKF